jgi:hypothetical protein
MEPLDSVRRIHAGVGELDLSARVASHSVAGDLRPGRGRIATGVDTNERAGSLFRRQLSCDAR